MKGFIIASCLVFLGAGCLRSGSVKISQIFIDGRPLRLEVVRTPEEQRKGLGGRTELAPDRGMLFVFSATGTPAFWMEGMRIPIDLLWIQDRHIVGIERDLPPPQDEEEPVTVHPPVPVDRVLELSAGGVARYGLEVGEALPEIP